MSQGYHGWAAMLIAHKILSMTTPTSRVPSGLRPGPGGQCTSRHLNVSCPNTTNRTRLFAGWKFSTHTTADSDRMPQSHDLFRRRARNSSRLATMLDLLEDVQSPSCTVMCIHWYCPLGYVVDVISDLEEFRSVIISSRYIERFRRRATSEHPCGGEVDMASTAASLRCASDMLYWTLISSARRRVARLRLQGRAISPDNSPGATLCT